MALSTRRKWPGELEAELQKGLMVGIPLTLRHRPISRRAKPVGVSWIAFKRLSAAHSPTVAARFSCITRWDGRPTDPWIDKSILCYIVGVGVGTGIEPHTELTLEVATLVSMRVVRCGIGIAVLLPSRAGARRRPRCSGRVVSRRFLRRWCQEAAISRICARWWLAKTPSRLGGGWSSQGRG